MFLSIPLILPLLGTAPPFAVQVAGPPLGRAEASLSASILSRTSVTSKILENFPAPLEVKVACDPYIVRDGTASNLNGVQWTASGANVCWLGLNEKCHPTSWSTILSQIQRELS
jgi:hypothetical protein